MISITQTQYAKKYGPQEDNKRQKVYVEAVKRVNDQNKLYNEGKSPYSLKINQYSDSSTRAPTGLVLPKYEVKETLNEVMADWEGYKVKLNLYHNFRI